MKKGLFIGLCLCSCTVHGQSVFRPTVWQYSVLAGHVVRNHPAFPAVDDPALGDELRVAFRLDGSRPWHRSYRYGTVGFSLALGSTGNSEVLGRFVALMPELTLPLHTGKRWRVESSFGLGAAWFDTPYDRVDNPENIMIGSPFTFCALAALNVLYPVGRHFDLALRPVIYHASNSHSNLPNVGMNLPMLGAGVRYRLGRDDERMPPDSVPLPPARWRANVRLGLAYNEQGGSTGPTDGPKYPIYLLALTASRKVSLVNNVLLGVEGWYNTGVYDYILSQDFYDNPSHGKAVAVAVTAGHEFLFGHFGLLTQLGVYAYNPFYRDKLAMKEAPSLLARLKTWVPARLGLQYHLFDETQDHPFNIFAGAYIKTNLGQADFLDTGIGVTF